MQLTHKLGAINAQVQDAKKHPLDLELQGLQRFEKKCISTISIISTIRAMAATLTVAALPNRLKERKSKGGKTLKIADLEKKIDLVSLSEKSRKKQRSQSLSRWCRGIRVVKDCPYAIYGTNGA